MTSVIINDVIVRAAILVHNWRWNCQLKRKCMLPGFFLSLQGWRKQYMEKLIAIGGVDPYEIPRRNEWLCYLPLAI